MPKKPRRHNRPDRDPRTVQSAASLLRRISQKAGGALPAAQTTLAGTSLIETLRALLPEELRQHLLEVLEKPGEVVLFTDSAVWAGRLKLAAGELSGFASGRRQVVRVMPRGGYRK
ncbi:MAG: hypothetical protein ABIQ86_04910 [Steroidobacteraceae bacterium]